MPNLSNQLFEAIHKNSLEAVHDLIERGVKINLKNALGETPLCAATRTGNLAIVELLIKNGAEINIQSDWGETPIFAAARNGDLKTVELLIKNGVDITPKSNRGETPLSVAVNLDRLNIVGFLNKIISLFNQLSEAIHKDSLEAVYALIDRSVESNLKNILGETPLLIAAKFGSLELVELLLEKGADVNLRNSNQETPLFIAAKFGKEKIVELLIKNGADITLKNNRGETPLFLAIQFKYTKISYTIIDHLLLRDINIEKPEILNTQGNLSNYWDKCKSKLQKIIISNKNKVISLHDFLTTQDDIKLVSLIRYKGVYNKLMWLKKKTNPQVGTIHGKLKLKFKEAVSKHKLHRKIEKKLKSLTFLNSYLDHITRVNLAQALSSVDISLFSETQLTSTLGSYVDCSHPGPFQIPRGSGPEKVVQ
ncbi:MAG: ankyrin repeat domain-containing protein [Candidatus Symbiodolus clandestinus]